MVKNYDCRNAFIFVDEIVYLIELEKANDCFETVELIIGIEDYSNAYILMIRALQLVGDAVLIKKFRLKSKSKNCQFQYLYEKKLISEDIIDKISKLSKRRNDIYYSNQTIDAEISEEEFIEKYQEVKEIKEVLELLI